MVKIIKTIKKITQCSMPQTEWASFKFKKNGNCAAQIKDETSTHLFLYRNWQKIIHVTGGCHKDTTIEFTHALAARKRNCLLLLLVQYTANGTFEHNLCQKHRRLYIQQTITFALKSITYVTIFLDYRALLVLLNFKSIVLTQTSMGT